MNRRTKHPKPFQSIIAGQIQNLDTDYSWTNLTMKQKKKCRQKFDMYKAPSCDKLSKYQLERMLREMGKDLKQEEILEKIWEADPKGQGFVSFQSFLKTIEGEKEKKFEEVTSFIGLTFDQVLAQQKKKLNDENLEQITWDFLKFYLSQNFEIQINIGILAGRRSQAKGLRRDQFMSIFT